MSAREAVREHNQLGGFTAVIIEMSVILLTSIFIAVSGVIGKNALVIIVGLGIAANATAIMTVAISQTRTAGKYKKVARHDRGTDHPGLRRRTLYLSLAAIVPFLLAILLAQGKD